MDLTVNQDAEGRPSVILGGIELAPYLAADGLSVDYAPCERGTVGHPAVPVVTLRFAPGVLDLDVAIDLIVAARDRAAPPRARLMCERRVD